MLTEQSVDVGDVVLNIADSETAGPSLVLLHGITLQWQSFLPVIPALAQDWHVYACDLRGHGKSDRAASYHMDGYVRDVAVLVNLQKGPTVLVGHSLGGMIALCAAAHLQHRVSALVLLDPAFIISTGKAIDNPAYPWCRWVYETLTTATSFEDILSSLRAQWPDGGESDVRERALMVSHIDPEVISIWFRNEIMQGIDIVQVLRQVTCPTLIVRAGLVHDSPLLDSDVALIEQHMADAEIVEVPNASHMLYVEQPEFVLERMQKLFVRAGANSST